MKLVLFLSKYLVRYFRYFWQAQTRYDIHSPFVSAFIENTLEDRRWYYIFDGVQQLKEKLALNDDLVEIVDHGAGSQLGNLPKSPVNRIARYSSITPFPGRLLFRIVKFLQPQRLLELGTSLGVSAIYQIAAVPRSTLVTIEGNPGIAELARQNIAACGLEQVQVRQGTFRKVLPEIGTNDARFDFFHFDGDHRYQPTLEYFEKCMTIAGPNSVFCFGDIYWSKEMEKAWKVLKRDPRVRLSIDLFHFGLLFLRPEQREKEDFVIVSSRRKPWRMGFFG